MRSETLSKGLDSKPKARLPKSNRRHFQEAGRKQGRRKHSRRFYVARRAIITDISNNGAVNTHIALRLQLWVSSAIKGASLMVICM
jgi:hypothetical protein